MMARSVSIVLLCASALLLTLVPAPVNAERLDALSFKPPFTAVDHEGRRVVNDSWTFGGSTEVKRNFIRLTTDRQSKRGYLWQREPLNMDTFSVVLTFRISGVGQRWYGDGIGLWLTNHRGFVEGPNHGFTDKFTGVGIVIDTFVNHEHKGGHKDVSILVNDGSKTIDQMNEAQRVGCDAAVRFHERSASFDPVHSMSRLKVRIDRQKLALDVDAANNGRWVACEELTLPFAADWLRGATLGLTGATGALADNHDIIRLDAYSEFADTTMGMADGEAVLHSVSKDYKKWLDSPNCGTDCLIAVLHKELANFRISAEHRFVDLKEKTDNNVLKLKRKEQENERRVTEIEQKVAANIDRTLEVSNQHLGADLNDKIAKELEATGVGGSWKVPFLLLALGLGMGGFYVYRKYQVLIKSHLL